MIKAVSKEDALQYYKWGNDCDGWGFVDNVDLCVKQERMPANTTEQLHYHQHAQQFFFILKGIATFEVEGRLIVIEANNGLHIPKGLPHKIMNNNKEDLEFILSSQPSTNNDRINL